MLEKIIHFSINNKFIIGLFTLALIVWGTYAVTQLPIDAVPDITNNQVQIITVSPSNAAEDIERFVTFPVEQTMATIPGIEEVRSFSRFGLSVVTVVFKENIDIYFARSQVNERLSLAKNEIPPGMGSPEMSPVTTGLGEIFQYIVLAKPGYETKYPPMELRSIQDWIIRRQLLGTEGVADVSSFGGYLKQYEIALDPDKLRSLNLTITDVYNALEKNNQNTGGAYIDKKPNAYFIRTEGLITSLEDIQNIVVKTYANGIPLLIRNVGTVQYGSAVRYGAMTRNGKGEVVGALVLMLKGANASEVIKNVKKRITQIEKTLPEGVVIEAYLDRTKLVNNAIGTVTKNLAEGALIVIFVLVLLLGNLRAGLIVASVIPLSMLFAVIMMNLFGVSGNLMSLGALDFGLIVDGAVIIVESVLHRITMSKTHHSGIKTLSSTEMDHEVQSASSRMMNSAVFGQIIILIVYIPILALVGVEGKMFRPMAQTVMFAIVGAFILSLTYVPMISAAFLNRKTEHKINISDRIIAKIQGIYRPALLLALKHKLIVIVSSVVLFGASLIVFMNMGGEFIPQLEEGDFAVETRVMTGSSLSETIQATERSAKILLKNFPEVKEVVGKVGSSEIPTDPMPVEAADIMVILKDKSEWTSASSREGLADAMQKKLEGEIPGVTFSFQQPIQMRFNELMTGARQDVVIKIFGEDLDKLAQYAAQAGAIARKTSGAVDVYVEEVTGLPQIVIKFKRDKIAQFGLNIEDVNQVLRAGFAGESAGQVFEDEKRFDLIVRLRKESRENLTDIKNLSVTAPNGNQIPMDQLADIDYEVGPNQIQRDDAKRRIIVGFNVRGRDVSSIVNEMQQKIDQQIKFEPGYSVKFGGTFENLNEARTRLGIAVPVALLLILILLFIAFNSFKHALLIFTAIPLSAIGGVFALWLRGMPFSISAGVGFIALFGVAVLNGIVLIAEFNRKKEEGMTDLHEIVLKGTAIRLRPVLLTALVASLGFLPMAFSNGSGAEVQKPLATVVMGGLLTATLLTLLVLPVLYIVFERIKKKSTKIMGITGILLFSLLSNKSHAQELQNPVTLDQALQQALQNNKGLYSARLDVDYQQQLKKVNKEISKTDVSLLYGQYNTLNKTDNNVTITQKIPFPTYFSAQAALGNSMIKSSKFKLAATENDLAFQVKSTYFQLQYLMSKKGQLLREDSLYRGFLKSADLRYRTGETNLLEKTTAETQLNELHNQIQQNQADTQIQLEQLTSLLNNENTIVVIADTVLVERSFNLSDTISLTNNPSLALIKQQVEIAQNQKRVEVAKALPDITLGYFSQTLIGNQSVNGTEVYYGSGDRFQGFQLGISLPIFSSFKAKVRAAEINAQVAESDYSLQQNNVNRQYRQSVQEYLKNKNSLAYYKSSALANAELILKQIQSAYKSGDISFAEYLISVRDALALRKGYLQALNEYNQSVVQLEFLIGNNQ
ncbi:Cobalt-zinc-cadmium resistance protein CzcA [Arcticibacter svalbardensis MN12-7]|uniref:Cobalt-zinc-cadmium resistance protein CzcA n=1 Tax=Arcticibacter svalbardensis MN12-7 TaxID=1150600 RepID=R9GX07_9SPHI|nr:CusA/CzcA family heavy metal efflux RND transporter [Arcticibacter svalbardensis]EOR96163.1 Cobalt-zinc-cadmium resistance protein CzcA [Arcticibacter svalbardensis MN12-7]